MAQHRARSHGTPSPSQLAARRNAPSFLPRDNVTRKMDTEEAASKIAAIQKGKNARRVLQEEGAAVAAAVAAAVVAANTVQRAGRARAGRVRTGRSPCSG